MWLARCGFQAGWQYVVAGNYVGRYVAGLAAGCLCMWLAGYLTAVYVGCLPGWLVMWLAILLTGYLTGWLATSLAWLSR